MQIRLQSVRPPSAIRLAGLRIALHSAFFSFVRRPSDPLSVRFPFHLAAAKGRMGGRADDGRAQLSGEKVSKAAIQARRSRTDRTDRLGERVRC